MSEPTLAAPLRELLAAIEPFANQDYHSETRTLEPGVSLGNWLTLEEAIAQARQALGTPEKSND